MKKSSTIIIAVFLAVLFIIPCTAFAGGGKDKGGSKPIIGAEGDPRPEWVTRPKRPTADTIYFVGRSATPTAATRAQSGLGDGLNQLAIWKESQTAAVLKRYVEEYGEVDNTQTLVGLENAVLTRAKANTSGMFLEEYWIDPEGIYVGLYSYPKNDFSNDFRSATNTFVRNQAAQFAEFKANQAFELLDSQLLSE